MWIEFDHGPCECLPSEAGIDDRRRDGEERRHGARRSEDPAGPWRRPARSGDFLAGLACDSAGRAGRGAARPGRYGARGHSSTTPLIAPEIDEVHAADPRPAMTPKPFAPIAASLGRLVSRMAAVGCRDAGGDRGADMGADAGNGRRRSRRSAQPGPHRRRPQAAGRHRASAPRSACRGGSRCASSRTIRPTMPRGVAASIVDGLQFGCGDAVIGINPATDSPDGDEPAARSDRGSAPAPRLSRADLRARPCHDGDAG